MIVIRVVMMRLTVPSDAGREVNAACRHTARHEWLHRQTRSVGLSAQFPADPLAP
ncbi:MAG TPA: hypothetical protein VJT72_09480 [Pseudonocardiaceae bacterium]|nr:hypothetical protein [Pseudonocardiaceae bacterium]